MLFFFVAEIYYLAWHLMLAWSFELGTRLGHFGLATVDKKVLRLEKGIQTKDLLMAWLHQVDLFVQMRVIGCRTKGII